MFLYLLGLVLLFLVFRWIRELPRVSDKGNKHVYITGCDSGFGNLLARHLDKLGFPVIAGCYTEKGEEELRKACSGKMTTTHLDVTSKESVAKVAAMIKQKVGDRGLWAVVNNAGVAVPSGPCDWHIVDDYKFMVDVNLHGVIAVTLSVIPLIKKAGGRVVNVASVFGRISVTGGPYPVSKFAVEGFNDSLRIGMAPFGVKVLCIEPGFFKTNVTDSEIQIKAVKGLWERLPQEIKDDYGSDYLDKGTLAKLFGFETFFFEQIFSTSHQDNVGVAIEDERRRPDEGGALHGARRRRRLAPQTLLPRLGRQVLLAADVLHADVHRGLHHAKRRHPRQKAEEVTRPLKNEVKAALSPAQITAHKGGNKPKTHKASWICWCLV
ncbi:Retinol dehydrogenase 3 [Oryzias melastigma]|uniref:Retinol dehydrogenase 3 n=1 Tax=Oryzias melastigma TaxID=30732 RepID=A0A834C2N6_ORYME|nr:Retinol dehydrogenase 3 [Oryzias melastigma]